MTGTDLSAELVERVREARARGIALRIVGGDTKRFLGRAIEARPLALAGHAGIVDYAPEELVLTARAGTTLARIEDALASNDQQLGFEPPRLGGPATIGGTLATNVSGPARPWRGSVRDAVLGIRIVSGRGEHLRFGGKVMKNVAGFDVARLQAGAYGAFGVLTEISLRVLPRPEREETLRLTCDAHTAIAHMNALAARPEPLSAAAWLDGVLYLRLSGTTGSVTAARRRIGGDTVAGAAAFWNDVNNLTLPFFTDPGAPLWRLSVSPSHPLREDLGTWLLDWGGAQRYLRSDRDRASLEAEAGGGHVGCLRHPDATVGFAQEPSAAVKRIHRNLKSAFDPDRIVNPGRLYDWF